MTAGNKLNEQISDDRAFFMSGLAGHLVNSKSCGFDAGILHAMCSQDTFKSQRTQQKT